MIYSAQKLIGKSIHAIDETFGTCKDILFDAKTHKVRYLVVDTGAWLPSKKVLIATQAVAPLESEDLEEGIPVFMTRDQVEHSPPLEDDSPIARQYEQQLYRHYGWAPYWTLSPADLGPVVAPEEGPMSQIPVAPMSKRDGDPELQSLSEVSGYNVLHADDSIGGKVDDLYVDAKKWSITHLVVKTGLLIFTDRKTIEASAIKEFDFAELAVVTRLNEADIADAPDAPVLDLPVPKEHEAELSRS